MKVRVRLFSRDARFVFVMRRHTDGVSTWVALGGKQANWAAAFLAMLELMGMPAQPGADALLLSDGAGKIVWHRQPLWTKITLSLTNMSAKKQQVVAQALLKAARYHR